MSMLPFVTALAATAAVAALPPSPAAANARYKATIASKQVVSLSALGQEDQENAQTANSFFQLALSDSAGHQVAHLVIDSLAPDPQLRAQVPDSILALAKGATYHLVIDGTGALTLTTIKDGGPLGKAFASSFYEFIPRVKGDLAAGREWADTTETSREIPNGALKTRTATNYAIGGAETVDGTAGTRVNAAFASSQTGAQETPGGTADLAGTSSGSSSWVLAKDGTILSATRKEEVKLTVTLAMAPAPIPITQTQDATITRLP